MSWIGSGVGRLGLLLGGGLWLGCSSSNPAFDTGGGSGDGTSAVGSSGAVEGTGGPATTGSDPPPATDGMSGTGGSTGAVDSTGAEQCSPPAVRGDYRNCVEATCDGTCVIPGAVEPVEFEQSVCATPCEEACDCPKPTSGSAEPTCGRDGCVLDCSAGQPCPNGMRCHPEERICVRFEVYGPCDDSCWSGFCFSIESKVESFGEVCPALDCLDGGATNDGLCPPGPTGNANPVCFEPGNFPGTGWCVLRCSEELECPDGMSCVDNFCLHPPP